MKVLSSSDQPAIGYQQKDIVLVAVQAERDVRYERIVEALNAVAKAQIANITFAATE